MVHNQMMDRLTQATDPAIAPRLPTFDLHTDDPFERLLSDVATQHRSKIPEYSIQAVLIQGEIGVDPVTYQLCRMLEKIKRVDTQMHADYHQPEWQSLTALLIDIAGHAVLAAQIDASQWGPRSTEAGAALDDFSKQLVAERESAPPVAPLLSPILLEDIFEQIHSVSAAMRALDHYVQATRVQS